MQYSQPFIAVNEKCSREKLNANATKANGDIQKEQKETNATNQGRRQTGFPGGFTYSVVYVKQDMITNGKHSLWQVTSLIKTWGWWWRN